MDSALSSVGINAPYPTLEKNPWNRNQNNDFTNSHLHYQQ